jgi:hypothetical protein
MLDKRVGSVQAEFNRSLLPDERLYERARRIAGAVARHPERGLPRLLDEASLEGTYRFMNNRRVHFDDLLAGHRAGTCERSAGLGTVLSIQDTTAFAFGGEQLRDGLSFDNGYTAHFAMLVTADGSKRPLGIGGVEALFRSQLRSKTRSKQEAYDQADKESLRWPRMVDHVEAQFGQQVDLIHVMDSEADWYDLLHHMVARGHRFIVRMSRPRVVFDGPELEQRASASELASQVCAVAEREVELSPRGKKGRPGKTKKKHPPRSRRVARLEIAARTITIPRPINTSRVDARFLTLNLVQVREVDAPADCEPVEWLLLTNEPIDEVLQILTIVDHYRTRWLIEEYFKALKTGCAYEKRQFESRHALLNMLAILVPIAWTLLAFRRAVDEDSTRPGTLLLTTRQQAVLRAALIERVGRDVLPEVPTERDLALGIARLGGYINKSRPPGWRILGYGYQDLLTMEAGWALAEGLM